MSKRRNHDAAFKARVALECQSARKAAPLSARNFDPLCRTWRSGPEPTELITEWRRVRP